MAAVPGSIFRRTLFWAHLCCGVAAGLLILLMSLTGITLAYEKQLIAAAARGNNLAVVPSTPALSADRLAEFARAAAPGAGRMSLVFDADPSAPVVVSRGREAGLLLNPYTGALIVDAAAGTRQFLRTMEDWHRWMGGDPRSTRANLMDLANLLFLFIVASGIYLWLPGVWRWRTVRELIVLRTHYINSKFRDFSWHHVFSFWMLIPLFLIALSGVVMSYGWANDLLFAAYGEQPPQRRAPEGPGGGPRPPSAGATGNSGGGGAVASLDALLRVARSEAGNWQRLTLPLGAGGERLDVVAELKSDSARPPRQTLTLSRRDGAVLQRSPAPGAAPVTQSAGQRARVWMRFVHTGEQYGVIGQTLAAIASLAACLLAYTGLALAFRRLVLPVLKRRKTA